MSVCWPSQTSSSCWLNSALVCILLPWSQTVYRLFSRAFLNFNSMTISERDRFDAVLLYACMLRHGGWGSSFRDAFLLQKLGLNTQVHQDDVSRGLTELMKVFPDQHMYEDRGEVRMRLGLGDAERALSICVEVGDNVRLARDNISVGLEVNQTALRSLLNARDKQLDAQQQQHSHQEDYTQSLLHAATASTTTTTTAAGLSLRHACAQGSNTLFSLEFDRRGNVVDDEHYDLSAVVSEHFKYRGEITWWSHTLSAYVSPRGGICEKLFLIVGGTRGVQKTFINLGDSCKAEGLVPLFLSPALQEITLPCMFSNRTWEDADFDGGTPARVDFIRNFPLCTRDGGDSAEGKEGEVHPVRFEWGSEFHTSGCTLKVCELLGGDAQSASLMCANWLLLLEQIATYGSDMHEEAFGLLRRAVSSGLVADTARALVTFGMNASALDRLVRHTPESIAKQRAAAMATKTCGILENSAFRKDYYARHMFRSLLIMKDDPAPTIERQEPSVPSSPSNTEEEEQEDAAFNLIGFRLVKLRNGVYACIDRISEAFAVARVCEFPAAFFKAARRNDLITRMQALLRLRTSSSAPGETREGEGASGEGGGARDESEAEFGDVGIRLREKLCMKAAELFKIWCTHADVFYRACKHRYVPTGIMLRVVRDHLMPLPEVKAVAAAPPPASSRRSGGGENAGFGFEASFMYVRKKSVHRTPGTFELSAGELFIIENPRRVSQHRFIVEIGEHGVVTFDKGVFSEYEPVEMEVVSGCIPTQKMGSSAAHWYSIVKADSGWLFVDSLRGTRDMNEDDALSKIEREAILIILRRTTNPRASSPPTPPQAVDVDATKIISKAISRLRKD